MRAPRAVPALALAGLCLLAARLTADSAAHAAGIGTLSPTWDIDFTLWTRGSQYLPNAESETPFDLDQQQDPIDEGPGTSSGPQTAKLSYETPGGVKAESMPFAEISNTALKIRSHLEGVLQTNFVSGPTCVPDPNVPGAVTCDNAPLVTGNWKRLEADASVRAAISDAVSLTHVTSNISGYRMVFQIDGTDVKFLDTFPTFPNLGTIGGTGGGYLLEFLYQGVYVNCNNQTIFSAVDRTDGTILGLNPAVPRTVTPRAAVGFSPFIPVKNGIPSPVNIEMSSLLKVALDNLDAGRVLFELEQDYSHTVHIGFEVYDDAGRLLPDAVVTGLNGERYTVRTTAIPEPAGLAWVGGAAIAAVGRRGRSAVGRRA